MSPSGKIGSARHELGRGLHSLAVLALWRFTLQGRRSPAHRCEHLWVSAIDRRLGLRTRFELACSVVGPRPPTLYAFQVNQREHLSLPDVLAGFPGEMHPSAGGFSGPLWPSSARCSALDLSPRSTLMAALDLADETAPSCCRTFVRLGRNSRTANQVTCWKRRNALMPDNVAGA